MHKGERDVFEDMRKIDECGTEKFGTLDSSDKTIAILGDRWWPQTAEQEGDKRWANSFCVIRVFGKIRFKRNSLPSAKKSKLPSHQVFGVFALEVNRILQATPSKLRREMGMCATTICVQQQQ